MEEMFLPIAKPATTVLQVNLPCEPPEGMQPLFDLLNSFVEIAFIAGVAVATLGFLYAGIRFDS